MLRALVAGVSLLAMASAANAGTLEEDAKAFGTRETVQSVDISPDGKKLLAIISGPGRSSVLRIVDAKTSEPNSIIMADGDPETIHGCDFASNTQLVCKYGGYQRLDDNIVAFSRLVTLGIDGKNIRQLGQRSHAAEQGIRQFDGQILDWLPDQQGSVLMARN